MKVTSFRLFFSLLFGLFLVSCQTIIEENLTDKTIDVIAPRDGALSTDNIQQFVWEPVEFALEYKIQVAKPSFELIDKLVIDSVTANTKVSYSLAPGSYEWRIKAINGSSETSYFTRKLTVTDTTNLNGSVLILKLPNADGYVNTVNPVFEWDAIGNATDYEFRIYEGDFENSNLVTNEVRTVFTSLSLGVSLSEKVYSWGVRGENDLSKTPFSSRTFLVDVSIPQVPILQLPADSSVLLQNNVAFSWSSVSNSGSPEFDSIFISADTALSNVVVKAESISSIFSYTLSQGDYYWAVRRFDRAGNFSWVSNLRKLTIQ